MHFPSQNILRTGPSVCQKGYRVSRQIVLFFDNILPPWAFGINSTKIVRFRASWAYFMLKMSKLTDYGTLVLVELGKGQSRRSAADIATATRIPRPTVSKLLKKLTAAGLVRSTRGAAGGYEIARPMREISAAALLDTLEGPIAITECAQDDSHCRLEASCDLSGAWQRVNRAIRGALEELTLQDLAHSQRPGSAFSGFDEAVIDHTALLKSRTQE